jgi:transcriptional regulator with XRE-family HTH domain
MKQPARNLVGPHVRRLRVELGLTQADLAAKLQRSGWDISREIVAQIEGGTRYVVDTELAFLAAALEVTLPTLLPQPALDAFTKAARKRQS